VSNDGGIGGIVWRQDGQELFYLSLPPTQTLMSVEISGGPAFQMKPPHKLFAVPAGAGAPAQLSAIGSPDGQRFVFAVNVPTKGRGQ
jgi:hypothetical protein